MRLLPAERAALDDLRSWLVDQFGGRIRALTLFGSRARGTGRADSDLDVLVAIEALDSEEAREIGYFAGDLLTRHDVLVSTLTVSAARCEHLRRRERRLARDIERDGIPL